MSAVQLKNRQRYFHETGYKNKLVSDNVQRTKTVTPPTIQGWAANSTPGIYQWHLPVFTGLENTPQVANTGKYWQIEFFAIKYSRNFRQDDLEQ